MNRITGILLALAVPFLGSAQGGDQQLRTKADALFTEGRFAEAYPLYSQLVSLSPGDHDLNYRFGACTLYGGDDKEKAIGHLKYACDAPNTPPLAWYFLGRSYHLAYRFQEALAAYERYKGTADKKVLAQYPVDALEQQCRNGRQLLSNLKDIEVHSKLEVDAAEFFRFYDLTGIGGRIVVTPDELLTSLDRKSGVRSLTYLPGNGGPIYFSSLGKDGRTGRDIYRTELLPTGQFAVPVKLAGYVNTDQDEDFPFLSTDGRYFYFASKGHNSMGGYDVFRTSYDKGMDVFAAPENLDFAVNTPDDDIFYMVDPEGKEACFASGRSSHQGKLHVYRVSTAQSPVNITVLKGTFASELDKNDRKAHLIVEDALTREKVADVRTDLNGNYVLALPRSGRYKFVVEAGPSGRTHVGQVDVPRSDSPKAYRQEMSLVDQAGQEKLMIRNYFEEPLAEDLIALALEEIKRRASLDVTGVRPVAEVPKEEAPTSDVMTAAGFTGDMTTDDAKRLAEVDARELTAEAAELERMSAEAFRMAGENHAEGQRLTEASTRLVEQANSLSDEAQRDALMTDAARTRQRALEANLRAHAALSTATTLDTRRMATAQAATNAQKLSTDLNAAIAANDREKSLTQLVVLKTRLDVKNGPDMQVDAAEQARRDATKAAQEAGTNLQRARSMSEEETELVERIERSKREQASTGGRARKEEIGREIAGLEQQLGYLREEVAASVAKAREAEQNAGVAQGQATLTAKLAAQRPEGTLARPSAEQLAAMERALAETDGRIRGLGIDERYDAAVMAERAGTAHDPFDWEHQGSGDAVADATGSTRTVERGNEGVAATTGNTIAVETSAPNAAALRTAVVPDVPVSNDGGAQVAENPSQQAGTVPPTSEVGAEVPGEQGAGREAAGTGRNNAGTVGTTEAVAGAAVVTGAVITGTVADASDGAAGEGTRTTTSTTADEAGVAGGTATEGGQVPARTEEELVSMRGVAVPSTSNEQGVVDEQAFIADNELAELKQLRAAERNKELRDSLDVRIADMERSMAQGGAQASDTVVPASEEPPTGEARLFEADATSSELDAMFLPEHAADAQRVNEGTLAAADKALVLHGLELMIVDSIDVETARQLALLDQDPTRAQEVLPRVERLRLLKEEHLRKADAILAANDQQYAAQETRAMEQAAQQQLDQRTAEEGASNGTMERNGPQTSHVDRYVSVHPNTEFVYESVVMHRSPTVTEAVIERDRELEQLADLGDRIDSLEDVLAEMPKGREYDKLRDRTDKLIDEEVILRTDLGQRLAFISHEEELAAKDSLNEVNALVMGKGTPVNEPLLLLANETRSEAEEHFKRAADMRKQADRSEDILERDRLFRGAYEDELMGLRALDRAITINNYLLDARHVAGESLTYVEVEERLFSTELMTARQGTGERATGLVESGVSTVPEGTVVVPAGDAPVAQAADVSKYERFMSSDAGAGTPSEMLAVDMSALALESDQARDQAGLLERRSIEMEDRAIALRDSALNAKKREREHLELEALRTQQLSDSLHQASLAMEQRAQQLDLRKAEVAEAKAFNERLNKYYYLRSEEQEVVMNETDHSRYFMARTKSIEQQQRSMLDKQESIGSRQLADTLLVEATGLLATPDLADGRVSEQRLAQAKVLNDRAVELLDRSDSLSASSERLKGAADLNDRQAAMLLQGMSAERSTEIMAMEQRARRTDPLIAESRALIAQVDAIKAREEAQALAAAGASRPAAAPTGSRTEVPTAQPVADPVVSPATTRTTGSEAPVPIDPVATTVPLAPAAGAPVGAFRAPEVLTSDIFGFRAEGSPVQPVAIDQPMPQGVVYKVQIGAFKNEIPKELFSDMTPVMGETTPSGVTRYTAGLFSTPEAAEKARALVRERGYRDAFVVAYDDGARIPMAQAVRSAQPLPAGGTVAAVVPADRPAAVIQAPVTPVIAAPVDDAQVLAAYPATAEELLQQFAPPADAAAYYNDPTAAPARQVETVKGLFFTVQVGVYSKPTALDKLFNITPLNSERTETNKIRYTTGVFLDMDKVRARKDEAVGLGVKDAFITAYLNGKRIPMREARALLQKFGPSVLADPSLATP